MMKLSALAMRAAARTSSRVALSTPNDMLLKNESLKSIASWFTLPIMARRSCTRMWRMSVPSMAIEPEVTS